MATLQAVQGDITQQQKECPLVEKVLFVCFSQSDFALYKKKMS